MRTIFSKQSDRNNETSYKTGWYIGCSAAAICLVAGCGGGGAALTVPPAGGGPLAGTANIAGQLVEGAGGRVTSAAGDSLSGVLVQLISTAGGQLSGSDITDLQGRYEFKGVPSGRDYLLKLEFASSRDLSGDGTPEQVELTLPLNPADQAAVALLSTLGAADSNGDGQLDAIRFDNEIGDDKGGLRQRSSEHRFRDHQSVIDDNGNGRFDDDRAFDDSDCDGLRDDNGGNSGGGGNSPSEREVYGDIAAISADSVTVNGVSFTLTTATRFMGRDKEPLGRDSFPVGTNVEVEGFHTANGLVAYKVKLEDHGTGSGGGNNNGGNNGIGDELEKTGNIEAISASSLSVGGVSFRLTENTVWRIDKDENANPALFTVGMRVEVTGDSDGQGGWIARRVKTED